MALYVLFASGVAWQMRIAGQQLAVRLSLHQDVTRLVPKFLPKFRERKVVLRLPAASTSSMYRGIRLPGRTDTAAL